MPYGHLTKRMQNVIRKFVQGRVVWDLGAGDLSRALTLLNQGAAHVHAVDRDFRGTTVPPDVAGTLTLYQTYFEGLQTPPEGIEVAYLAWPMNHPNPGLNRLLAASEVVIYVGCNVEGTSCGTEQMFRPLVRREILDHVPHRRNSLIVYGRETGRRPLVAEEFAATQPDLLTFEEACQRARQAAASFQLDFFDQ